MSQETSALKVAVSSPRITLLMVLCGIAGATAAGAASAATRADDAPSIVVRFTPETLDTDHGARVLYTRIVHAAEQVCPADLSGSRFVNPAVRHCRDQAVARAVHDINNSRLAAVYTAITKRG